MFLRSFSFVYILTSLISVGCSSSDQQVQFNDSELKPFKDEFVSVLNDAIAIVEDKGVDELLSKSAELTQRVYDKYPQNAGSKENAITELIDRLDVVLEDIREDSKESAVEQLRAFASDVEAL